MACVELCGVYTDQRERKTDANFHLGHVVGICIALGVNIGQCE